MCRCGVNYDLWLLIAGKPRVPAFPRPGMRITVNPKSVGPGGAGTMIENGRHERIRLSLPRSFRIPL
jgi:hypothetical protein